MKLSRNKTVTSDSRWKKYAIASTASASVMLGSQNFADADVTQVYVGTFLEDRTQGNSAFDTFGPYSFGASGASFVFMQAFNETGPDVGILTITGYGNISFVGSGSAGYYYPSNLAYGQNVSTAGPFEVRSGDRGDMAWGSGYTRKQFQSPGISYVGFRFDVGSGTQHGFIELDMLGIPDNRATFIGYAWADPGEAISTFSINVPEPSSLGALAMGSVGLLAWRRRRAKAI